MSSLDVSALDEAALRSALLGTYAAVDVVPSTGSTNADLLASAEYAADRTVLLAETQTAGRGRRSRTWVSPERAGLYLSVLLRPQGVPTAKFGSLAMVAGLALIRVAEHAGVRGAVLKWPNDLLAGPGRAKCAGVLAEVSTQADPTVVLGIGLNVGHLPGEVPTGPGGLAATSFAEQGSTTGRTEVAVALLLALSELEGAWRSAGGDLGRAGLLDEYRDNCATLGTQVRVELPDSAEITGRAADVDGSGQLVIDLLDGTERTVSAGDVVHLRTSS